MKNRIFRNMLLSAALLLSAVPAFRADAAAAETCVLPGEITIFAPPRLSAALADFKDVCTAYDLKTQAVTRPDAAFLRLVLSDEDTPEHPQGYRFEIARDGITIASRSPEGLFNGLQTLTVMLRSTPGVRELPLGRRMESPGIEQRAVSFSVRKCPPGQLPELKRFLLTIAALKYNRAFVEFGDNFPLPRKLFPRNKYPFSEEQLREIMLFAEDRFLSITPMLRVWSDCPMLESRSDREVLLEVPRPSWGLLTYCPRNPKLQELIRQTVSAQCRFLRPNEFFFRIDRADLRFHFRKCPLCKDIPAEKIISEHLDFLVGCAKEEKAAPGFILLNFPEECTEKIIAMLPPGTPVLGSPAPGRNPDAATAASREKLEEAIRSSHRGKARCFLLLEKPFARGGEAIPISNTSPWLWCALVYGGNAMWSPEAPAVSADPAALFRRLFSSRHPDELPRNAIPVPITKLLNANLGTVDGFPKLNDPEQLKQMREELRKMPEKFEITIDNGANLYGAVLSGDPRIKNFPEKIEIPLNDCTAEYLALLISCSRPLQYAEFDPAEHGVNAFEYPGIAFIRLNFANDKTYTKRLRYQVGITDWNRRFSGYSPRFAVTGRDRYGRFFHFDCLRVKNTHPEVPLKSVTIYSYRRHWLAPVLLSLSLLNAEAKPFPTVDPQPEIARINRNPPPHINIPRIRRIDFENAALGEVTVKMNNARFGSPDAAPQLDFPVDSEAPSHDHVLRIVIPAATPETPEKTIDLQIDVPESLRGSVRAIGFAAKIDHPEYLAEAQQVLMDSRRGSTYEQMIFPHRRWRMIWTALDNPDRRSKTPLHTPGRADTRRIVFRFRNLPEPVTVMIDDIGHSRWRLHTSPEIMEP